MRVFACVVVLLSAPEHLSSPELCRGLMGLTGARLTANAYLLEEGSVLFRVCAALLYRPS